MPKLNPSKDPKYFIAIIPPSPVYEEAKELKHYFQAAYQSKGALKSPPHITLHMPFLWKEKKESSLITELDLFAKRFVPFRVELKDFGAFEPRVIFIHVEQNELLSKFESALSKFCQTKLQLFNSSYKARPFHPHLTIAFCDLKKEQFKTAWKEFESKSFARSFLCDSFYLLKHDGKVWHRFKQFSLSKDSNISNLV